MEQLFEKLSKSFKNTCKSSLNIILQALEQFANSKWNEKFANSQILRIRTFQNRYNLHKKKKYQV